MEQVDELVLGGCPQGQAGDAELQFQVDGDRVDGLQRNGRRRIADDLRAGLQHRPHHLLDKARPLVGGDAHTQDELVSLVGAAEIGHALPCQHAVRQHDDIVCGGQQVGGAPVGLGHAALGAVVQPDPVADGVSAAQRQRDAGKHITERVLQRQAQDDGDDARGRHQGADRQTEHETDHRQGHAEIDRARGHVLDQVRFPRLAVEPDIDVDEADAGPCEMGPPQDPGRFGEQRGKTLRGEIIGLLRIDAPAIEHETHAGEDQDLHDQPAGGAASPLKVPHHDAGQSQHVDQHKRQDVVITEHGWDFPIVAGRAGACSLIS